MNNYQTHYGERFIKQPMGSYFNDGLAPIYQNKKWGYANKSGNIVIPCQYKYMTDFSEGLAVIEAISEDQYITGFQIIDTRGQTVFSIEATDMEDFHCGLACFSQLDQEGDEMDKYGYIDKTGKIVIPPTYIFADCFSDGLAYVENEDAKGGYINTSGEIVIPLIYDDGLEFANGFTLTEKKSEKIVINEQGYAVYKWKEDADSIYNYSEGVLCRHDGNTWTIHNFADHTEKELQDYDCIDFFSEGMAEVKDQGGKSGFINTKGELVVSCIYDQVRLYKEGYAAVQLNGNWGFIDKKGKVVVPLKHTQVEKFSDGLVKVYSKNKSFFVNSKGQTIISLKEQRTIPKEMWLLLAVVIIFVVLTLQQLLRLF